VVLFAVISATSYYQFVGSTSGMILLVVCHVVCLKNALATLLEAFSNIFFFLARTHTHPFTFGIPINGNGRILP